MFFAARQRISGSDAGFLYIESGSQTSTCTHTLVLGAPPAGQSPLTRDDLVAHLRSRIDRTPHLRRRLEQVPGGIGHALMVDDPDFDLDAHVLHARLPDSDNADNAGNSGDDAAFHTFLAAQLPLRHSLDHALWRVTLLDGLTGARQALVFSLHHTLADGAGLLNTFSELLEDRAAQSPPLVDPRQIRPAPAPPRAWLFVTTLLRQLVVWMTFPLLLVVSVRRLKAVQGRRESAAVSVPPMAGGAPRTVLNNSCDNERRFAHTSLPLDQVRQVRSEAGTTLSDVVLAVVAGALRGYLADRDELPEGPLVVNVPLGHDAPDAAPRLSGNVFCNYYAFLPTDEPDARVRLTLTAARTSEAKHQLEIQGRDTLITWLNRIPPSIAWRAAQKMAAKHRAGLVDPDFNVLVSNLRVPGGHWTIRDLDVEEIIFSGPVADGAGLNITVVGYGDRLIVALQTNPSAVDDPAELADRLHDALAELVAADDTGPVHDKEGQVA